MARARVVFELDGLMYGVGPVRIGLAMRAATSREFSLLRPFPTVAAAERMCRALARAQVIAFADDQIPSGRNQIDGLDKRKRRRRTNRRRRVPRTLVEPMSTPAARPSAPPRPSAGPAPGPSLRRSSLDRRPSPEVVAALDQALDRVEQSLS
jgi:hypothetical protein